MDIDEHDDSMPALGIDTVEVMDTDADATDATDAVEGEMEIDAPAEVSPALSGAIEMPASVVVTSHLAQNVHDNVLDDVSLKGIDGLEGETVDGNVSQEVGSGDQNEAQIEHTIDDNDAARDGPTDDDDDGLEVEEYPTDVHTLPPIVIHLPKLGSRSLFGPSDKANSVWLSSRSEELGEASLSDVWLEIKNELVKEGLAQNGEMILTEKQMELKMGEDDVHLQYVTLLDLAQVHYGCGLSGPVDLYVSFEPHRFITRFNAIQKEVQAQLDLEVGEGDDEEEDVKGEDEDAVVKGEGNEHNGAGGEGDLGETVEDVSQTPNPREEATEDSGGRGAEQAGALEDSTTPALQDRGETAHDDPGPAPQARGESAHNDTLPGLTTLIASSSATGQDDSLAQRDDGSEHENDQQDHETVPEQEDETENDEHGEYEEPGYEFAGEDDDVEDVGTFVETEQAGEEDSLATDNGTALDTALDSTTQANLGTVDKAETQPVGESDALVDADDGEADAQVAESETSEEPVSVYAENMGEGETEGQVGPNAEGEADEEADAEEDDQADAEEGQEADGDANANTNANAEAEAEAHAKAEADEEEANEDADAEVESDGEGDGDEGLLGDDVDEGHGDDVDEGDGDIGGDHDGDAGDDQGDLPADAADGHNNNDYDDGDSDDGLDQVIAAAEEESLTATSHQTLLSPESETSNLHLKRTREDTLEDAASKKVKE